MRSIRDMIRNLMNKRHDRRELPFPRHQARHRELIRDLIAIARAQDTGKVIIGG